MTPARATEDITAPNTGEREQSTVKKSRNARKNDLLSFLGEGARMPPPSKEGTPINAVKMQRTPGSGASAQKRRGIKPTATMPSDKRNQNQTTRTHTRG
jgi:hypothetical protein